MSNYDRKRDIEAEGQRAAIVHGRQQGKSHSQDQETRRALEIVLSRLKLDTQTAEVLRYHHGEITQRLAE